MAQSAALTKASGDPVPVDPEQTLKACKALVAHIKKRAAAAQNEAKPNLLADEESTIAETPVWLTLTTKKHIHDSRRMSIPRRAQSACVCVCAGVLLTSLLSKAFNRAKSSCPTPSTPTKRSACA